LAKKFGFGIYGRGWAAIALQGGPLQSCRLNMKCSAGLTLPAVLSPLGPWGSRSCCNMFQRVCGVYCIYTVISLQGGPLQSRRLSMKCSAGLAVPAVLRRPRLGSSWSYCNMFQRLVWGIDCIQS
jgi:hypothetical protein